MYDVGVQILSGGSESASFYRTKMNLGRAGAHWLRAWRVSNRTCTYSKLVEPCAKNCRKSPVFAMWMNKSSGGSESASFHRTTMKLGWAGAHWLRAWRVSNRTCSYSKLVEPYGKTVEKHLFLPFDYLNSYNETSTNVHIHASKIVCIIKCIMTL